MQQKVSWKDSTPNEEPKDVLWRRHYRLPAVQVA